MKKHTKLEVPPTLRIVQLSTPATFEGQPSVQAQIAVIFFPATEFSLAKCYWQHTGEGVSSRLAEYCLERLANAPVLAKTPGYTHYTHRRSDSKSSNNGVSDELKSETDLSSSPSHDKELATFLEERFGRNLDLSFAAEAKMALKRRIATKTIEAGAQLLNSGSPHISSLSEEDVYLYPTGMTSIFSAHRALLEAMDPEKSVCFGFPYVDTLNILRKFGPGVYFYGHGESEDLEELEEKLEGGLKIMGFFCEFPSNPLLKCPDLKNVRRLADKYNFAVVVDETVGNFLNVHVLPYSDIVVSSLTKVFSGDSNVMGGSLILNPQGPFYSKLKKVFGRQYQDIMWAEDAIFMERNSRDFAERNARINDNALAVAQLFQQSPLIKSVFYPLLNPTRKFYDECKVSTGGYGGLLSVVFKEQDKAKLFFDRVNTAKGPSLGTNFTLTSPYAILAHFNELDWIEQFGVDRDIIRISVGLETQAELLQVFESGLSAAAEHNDTSATN